MRTVEVENGHLRVGWNDPSWRGEQNLTALLISTMTLAGLGALLSMINHHNGLLMALAAVGVAALLLFFHQSSAVYRVMELDAQGLKLSYLRKRSVVAFPQPSVDMLRRGKNSPHFIISTPESQRIAYADVADMGHTDFSIWLADEEGTRTEIRLDAFPREEISRLFERIEPTWRRIRSGLAEDPEPIRRSQEQVQFLAGHQG